MKLILFAAAIMFKCSRLSSAPADTSPDGTLKNNSEKEVALNQPGYVVAHHPNGLAYVSNDEDLGTTGVVFQFRRSIKSDNTEIEARRRSALDKGFMRFGRAGPNMMRFGRSPVDPESDAMRIRKNDKNMMRFGRAGNMMRFGRSHSADYSDEYDDSPDVDGYFNKSPEEKGNKILRLGRSSSEENSDESSQLMPEKNDERLGVKKNDKNIMRFGRGGNMMRFGRGNMMRFGKRGNMMRFGRSDMPTKVFKPPLFFDNRSIRGNDDEDDRDEPQEFSNDVFVGKRKGNLIRFGRNEKNLMRFGKRSGPQAMTSSTKIYCEDGDCLLQENENLSENGAVKSDQLQELFGGDPKQGYGEYIIEK
jgi:hypothetical protein